MRFFVSAAVLLLSTSTALADCAHPETINLAEADTWATEASNSAYCYQFAARAGQRITLSISGAKNDAVFAIFAPGWEVTCNVLGDCDVEGEQLTEDDATNWSDIAPSTGNYLIVIDNSKSDVDYELNVEIH